MSESSPASYNPNERIKRHLKRKSGRSLAPLFNSVKGKGNEEDDVNSCPPPTSSGSLNPFKVRSPANKRKPTQFSLPSSVFEWEDSNAQDPFSGDGFPVPESGICGPSPEKSTAKDSPKTAKQKGLSRYRSLDPSALLKECYATDFSDLLHNPKKKEEVVQEEEEAAKVPMDLRLGTKLRLTSNKPFSWMKGRKTTGIVSVRLTAADRYEGLKFFSNELNADISKLSIPKNPSVLFEAASLYWQFPVFPGISLYPRISSVVSAVQRIPTAAVVHDTINNQWVECIEQLFMSWKKGDRRSFYVATAAFNVLFVKTSNDDEINIGEDSISCFQNSSGEKLIAIVTHTTSVVREAIRSEGVEYEILGRSKRFSSVSASNPSLMNTNTMSNESLMSVDDASCSLPGDEKENSNSQPVSCEKEELSDDNESPTKANQKWLKEIGVSPRNVMKTSATRRLHVHSRDKADGISSLLVKGPSVQALYNMLQTSRLVHEVTGAYSKIPPTLIAQSPFLYAQMLSLNKTSHVVQKVGKPTEYVVELDRGPILPHAVELGFEFLRAGNFCNEDVPAGLRVNDRYSSLGMNSWSDRFKDWSFVKVFPNRVLWSK